MLKHFKLLSMTIEQRRGSDVPGIVELDPAPPTRSSRLRIVETIISNGEPALQGPPLDELIDRLGEIVVSEDMQELSLYLDELRKRKEKEISENNRALGVWEKLKNLSNPHRQIIIDGHPVGAKTTAVVAGILTSVVGAGVYMKLTHHQPKPTSSKGHK